MKTSSTMIRQKIRVRGWKVWVYYAVHEYYAEEIMENLRYIGISEREAQRATNNLCSGKKNTGLTYANKHMAVMVIGLASSAAQYANSISHETHHLGVFIAKHEGIRLDSEEVCYISGEIAEKLHPVAKVLTSECGCYDELFN